MRLATLLFPVLLLAIAVPAHAETFSDFIAEANARYRQGDYEAAAQNYENAFALQHAEPTHYYNAACSWALAGDTEKSFAMLEMAVDSGYRNSDWMLADEDLAPLRADPQWKPIVERCRQAEADYLQTINAELYEMFQADQSDRQGDVDWSLVGPRDAQRRERVLEFIESDLLVEPDDFVHAAFIFQHGADSTSYGMAHELAMKAVELDSTYTRARWIAAASKDRYLQSVGSPQIYGTQLRKIDGVWTLEPFDTTVVSDAERERSGVRPLARSRAWAAGANKPAD